MTAATRKSIKQHFPLGDAFAKGFDSPLTVHAIDEDLFPRIWALLAEATVVDAELSRTIREAISTLVSRKNSCPMCITAHELVGKVTSCVEKEASEEVTEQALSYSAAVQQATKEKYDLPMLIREDSLSSTSEEEDSEEEESEYPALSPKAKAEAALVVLTFQYFNRVVLSLLGEELTTTLFGVPRPLAKKLEKPNVMKYINRMLVPYLKPSVKTKYDSGLTENLFKAKHRPDLSILPDNLKGVIAAGEYTANSLARLCEWEKAARQASPLRVVITDEVLRFVEDPANSPCTKLSSMEKCVWLFRDLIKKINASLERESDKTLAHVFLLVEHSPQSLYNSNVWNDMIDLYGKATARHALIWFAVHISLLRAKGF